MLKIKNKKDESPSKSQPILYSQKRFQKFRYAKTLRIVLDNNFQNVTLSLLKKKRLSIKKIDCQITPSGIIISKLLSHSLCINQTLKSCLRNVISASFKSVSFDTFKFLILHLKSLKKCHISIQKPGFERYTYKEQWFPKYGLSSKLEGLSLNFDHVPFLSRKFMTAIRKKGSLQYFELNYKFTKFVFLDSLMLFQYIQFMKKLNHLKLKPLIIGDKDILKAPPLPLNKLLELKSVRFYCPLNFHQVNNYSSIFEDMTKSRSLQSLNLDIESSMLPLVSLLKNLGGLLSKFKSVVSLRISIKSNGDEVPNEFFYGLQDISLKTLILTFTKMRLKPLSLRLLGTALISSQHLHKLGLSFYESEVQGSIFEILSSKISKLSELKDLKLSHPTLYEENTAFPYQNLTKVAPLQHLELELYINWKADEKTKHLVEFIEKQNQLVYFAIGLNSTSMHSRYSADISACEDIFKAITKLESLRFLFMNIGKFRKNLTNKKLFTLNKVLSSLKKLKWLQMKLVGEFLEENDLLDLISEIITMKKLYEAFMLIDIRNLSNRGREKFKRYIGKMEKFDDFELSFVGQQEQENEINVLRHEVEKVKFLKLNKL